MTEHEYLPVVAILVAVITVPPALTTIVFLRNAVGDVGGVGAHGAHAVCALCRACVVGQRVAAHEFHGVVAED